MFSLYGVGLVAGGFGEVFLFFLLIEGCGVRLTTYQRKAGAKSGGGRERGIGRGLLAMVVVGGVLVL